MSSIALGVVVLNRVGKLEQLLESVRSTSVDIVYVADNGKKSKEKSKIYQKEYPYDLKVLDLEYDIGLGYSRDQIVQKFEEDYLLVTDSDHRIPGDIDRLISILEERPELGGVAGSMVEPDRGRFWQSAKDFCERDGSLVRSPDINEKEIESVNDSYFIEFDFVPYPTLYRRECLMDYSWDPEYPLGRAHVDFYVGHWKRTDWSFGICPNVYFEHFPGGDRSYTTHRRDSEKYAKAKNHFRDKWEYDDIEMERSYWYDTDHDDRTLAKRALDLYKSKGIKALLKESTGWLKNNLRM